MKADSTSEVPSTGAVATIAVAEDEEVMHMDRHRRSPCPLGKAMGRQPEAGGGDKAASSTSGAEGARAPEATGAAWLPFNSKEEVKEFLQLELDGLPVSWPRGWDRKRAKQLLRDAG